MAASSHGTSLPQSSLLPAGNPEPAPLHDATTNTGQASHLRLAVGIATAGRPGILARVLAEFRNQERAADRIVVCAPTLADVGDVVNLDGVTVVTGPRGLTLQRNAILDSLDDCDAVVFFDDDFIPRADYLREVETLLLASPDVVMTTGLVLRDGIIGPGLTFDDARAALDADAGASTHPPVLRTVYNGYGCNMSVRLATVRQHHIRFDESLGSYAWLEDVDFSRQLARYGEIVHASSTRGVHLGVKLGRQSGLRFGYSQIANPLYLVRKGSCSWRKALHQMSRNVAMNVARSAWPESYVDRRGRLRGNLLALRDLLRGSLDPSRILSLSN
ncbi:glycosyltransferase family 2 protein [Methylobacterium oxalidis]|uniref:glycosyltransferase family 2 protein n=1 Tax=Methylobacterium oxalidis TaxID=944322 RepID=UPI0033160CA3